MGPAAHYGWMPISAWGTSSSSQAGDGDDDAGADFSAVGVAVLAAAALAKWNLPFWPVSGLARPHRHGGHRGLLCWRFIEYFLLG